MFNACTNVCQALPFGPVGIAARYHSKHLETFSGEEVCNDRMYERSLYAFTRVYNRLPQSLADAPSVSTLQARLTHMAKEKAKQGHEDWRRCFQDCHEINGMFPNS